MAVHFGCRLEEWEAKYRDSGYDTYEDFKGWQSKRQNENWQITGLYWDIMEIQTGRPREGSANAVAKIIVESGKTLTKDSFLAKDKKQMIKVYVHVWISWGVNGFGLLLYEINMWICIQTHPERQVA